jgi:general secretion pathway protein A
VAALYLDFYGLHESPFNPSPDPRFLMLTPGHREALAQMSLAVQQRKGFAMLSGEIGTGKTTLVRTLCQQLETGTAVAFVANSLLSFEGILEFSLKEWGMARPGDSHADRLFSAQVFLLERSKAGLNTVLVLDEAQNFSTETLEQVRLLSNFETSTDKLLQILLVGQPELKTKIELPELRQLRQRIGMRCTIQPLTLSQTRHYIWNRLRVAGGRTHFLFDDAAINRIAEASGGVPRVINTICDHALTLGYGEQCHRVGVDIIEEAARYVAEGDTSTSADTAPAEGAASSMPVSRRWMTAAALVALGAAVALAPTAASGLSDLARRAAASWACVEGAR